MEDYFGIYFRFRSTKYPTAAMIATAITPIAIATSVLINGVGSGSIGASW